MYFSVLSPHDSYFFRKKNLSHKKHTNIQFKKLQTLKQSQFDHCQCSEHKHKPRKKDQGGKSSLDEAKVIDNNVAKKAAEGLIEASSQDSLNFDEDIYFTSRWQISLAYLSKMTTLLNAVNLRLDPMSIWELCCWWGGRACQTRSRGRRPP